MYRAGDDVRNSFLRGAVWFDPADTTCSGFDVIKKACEAGLPEIQTTNQRWLSDSVALAETHSDAVFGRIAAILCHHIPG